MGVICRASFLPIIVITGAVRMDMHIFSFPSENKTWTLNDLHDSEESPVSVRFGGPSRTRTDNIFLAKEALYHWSYRPIFYSLLVYFTNSEDSGSRTHSVETPDLQSSPALQLRRIHKALFSPEGSTRVFNSTRKLQSLLKEPSTAVKRHANPSSCSTTTSKLGDAGGS